MTRHLPRDLRSGKKTALQQTDQGVGYAKLAAKIKKASELYLANAPLLLAKSGQQDQVGTAAQNYKNMPPDELVKILRSDDLRIIHRQLQVDGKHLPTSAKGLQLIGAEGKANWVSLLLVGVRGNYKALAAFAREPMIAITTPDEFGAWREERVRLQEADLRFLVVAADPNFAGDPLRQGHIMDNNDFVARVSLLSDKASEEQLRKLIDELKVSNGKGGIITLDDLGKRDAVGFFAIEREDLLDKLTAAYGRRLEMVAEHFGGPVATVKEASSAAQTLKKVEFNDLLEYRRYTMMSYVVDQNIVLPDDDNLIAMRSHIDDARAQFQSRPQPLRQPKDLPVVESRKVYNDSLLELDSQCAGCLLARDGQQRIVDEAGLFTVRDDARVQVEAQRFVISNVSVKGKTWDIGAARPGLPEVDAGPGILSKFRSSFIMAAFVAAVSVSADELDDELGLSANPARQAYIGALGLHARELEMLWQQDK